MIACLTAPDAPSLVPKRKKQTAASTAKYGRGKDIDVVKAQVEKTNTNSGASPSRTVSVDLSQESKGSVAETEVVDSDSQEGLPVPHDDLTALPADIFDDLGMMPVDTLLDLTAAVVSDDSNMRNVEVTAEASSTIQGRPDQIEVVGDPKGSMQVILAPQVSSQPAEKLTAQASPNEYAVVPAALNPDQSTKVGTTCASTPITGTTPRQKSLDMGGTNAGSKRRKKEGAGVELAAESNKRKKPKPGDYQ